MNSLHASQDPRLRRFGTLLNAVPFVVGFALVAATAGLFHARYGTLGAVVLGIVTSCFLLTALWLSLRNIGDWSNLQQLYRSRRRQRLPADGTVLAHEGQLLVDGKPLVSPFTGVACAAYTYCVKYHWSRTRGRGSGSDSRLVAAGFHMLPMRVRGDAQTLALRSFPTVEDDSWHVRQDEEWHPRLKTLMHSLPDDRRRFTDFDRLTRWLQLQCGTTDSVHEDMIGGALGKIPSQHTIQEWVLPADGRVCVIGTYDERSHSLRAGRWRPGGRLTVYQGRSEQVLPRVWREVKAFGRMSLLLLLGSVAFYALTLGHPSSLSELVIGPGQVLVEAGDPADRDWTAGTRAAIMLWVWPLLLLVSVAVASRTLPLSEKAQDQVSASDRDHSGNELN